jgi:hypothetical protein
VADDLCPIGGVTICGRIRSSGRGSSTSGRVGSIWVDLAEHGLLVHILDRMTTQAAGTEPHLSERIGGASNNRDRYPDD